jgi:succinate dehydrogenase / fumarate reductase cytochrome b subunit
MSENPPIAERPLSPHLQVYRLPMTAKTSISHRISGVLLTFGLIILSAWIIAAGMGEEAYNNAMTLVDTPITLLIFLGWAFVLFYHMANGVRHLVWDTGTGISMKAARISGTIIILFAVLATLGVWFAAGQYNGGEETLPPEINNMAEANDGAE